MKVLSKRGRPASILFKCGNVDIFDEKTLTLLVTKYSDNFDFEFIPPSVMKSYLSIKNKFEEKRQSNHNIENELYGKISSKYQKQKDQNEYLLKSFEKEHQNYNNMDK